MHAASAVFHLCLRSINGQPRHNQLSWFVHTKPPE